MNLHTKKDFEECLLKIIEPLKDYYSDGKALLKCGSTGVKYGEKTACMEGFSRVLWGLAPLWGGEGSEDDFENIYLQGLINGTDPTHPEYWGELVDYDQMLVECAAIGLALILAPDKVWEPLTSKQKNNFYRWLSKVNQVKCYNNNWKFFAVLVNLGLRQIGMPYSMEVMNDSLESIHSFYLDNGWYRDGFSTQMDYYIPFAIHFYGLIYAKVMEKDDPVNSKIFKERAMRFAQDFIYWFADDGAALPFGRSLTYRFAQCCFWSACVFAGIEPFPLGVMKGIIARNLNWWMEKPIFDNAGILSIGYGYSSLYMSEQYNGHGSPYWALKTFLLLALKDNDDFFKVEAEKLPELDKLHVIPEARMVIQRIDGQVVALTSGQWAQFKPAHVAEKYSKFVYSTKYAFSVPRSYYGVANAGTDNMLAFVQDNDEFCFVRRECSEYKIEADGRVYSKWSPYSGVEVETWLIPTERGHRRKHMVTCEKACTAYDCGFSGEGDVGIILGQGEAVIIGCAPNSNLVYPLTQMQAVKYELIKGITCIETEFIYPEW